MVFLPPQTHLSCVVSVRRAHLKECFETLKKNIPNIEEKKTSNLSVLRSALRYIQVSRRFLYFLPERFSVASQVCKTANYRRLLSDWPVSGRLSIAAAEIFKRPEALFRAATREPLARGERGVYLKRPNHAGVWLLSTHRGVRRGNAVCVFFFFFVFCFQPTSSVGNEASDAPVEACR